MLGYIDNESFGAVLQLLPGRSGAQDPPGRGQHQEAQAQSRSSRPVLRSQESQVWSISVILPIISAHINLDHVLVNYTVAKYHSPIGRDSQ